MYKKEARCSDVLRSEASNYNESVISNVVKIRIRTCRKKGWEKINLSENKVIKKW